MEQDHPSTTHLAAYADQELTAPESVQIAKHLESCPLCQEYVSGLEGISSRLKSYALPTGLGDGTPERVLGALPDRQARRQSSGMLTWLPPTLLAAANVGLQAVFIVALALTALSVFGVVDTGSVLITWLPTAELPAEASSVSRLAGDVLGWLTFGSLGPAFRSLMDSAGLDATTLLSWLVPAAITLAVPIVLGAGFVGWLAVAWGVESRSKDRSPRTA